MTYVVFSQEGERLPVERLTVNGARFFDAKLEVLEEGPSWTRLRLICSRPAHTGEFRIEVRATTKDDLADARDAEVRGRAAGMGALAEKCRTLWVIETASPDSADNVAFLTLSAICASVALGPVLPPDHATLFGVRGAIERRDRAISLEKTQG